MAIHARKAIFESVELKDGSGWYVRLTLPKRVPAQITRFKTKAEAQEWIKIEAANWLKRFEGGKHA
jgi:hypothetical protein